MALSADADQRLPVIAAAGATAGVRSRAWRSEPAAAALIGVALTSAWTLTAGKDLCSDVLNHHVYLPYSLMAGRYAEDLFAAGPQSYQNPVGYLPFYWMIQAGWPSWTIGLLLAALHGLMLAPVAVITQALWGDGADHRWWRWLAMALAWVSPAFLIFAGTSSIDPTCHLLVLITLAVTLVPGQGWHRSLLGGLALGLAFAIKPTNAVFALAIAATLMWRVFGGQTRWRQVAILIGGAMLAAVAVMGFWSYWLWATFGNPMFPLFNQHFHSPFAPQQEIVALRFLPQTLVDWLWRPFEMAELRKFTAAEMFAPDLRPAALVVLTVLALPLMVWRRAAWSWRGPVVQLAVFTLVAYCLWMQSSGNSRYAMPLLAAAAVLLVAVAKFALPRSAARIALGTLLLLHSANFWAEGDHRLAGSAWSTGPYLDIDVPQRLREVPFLHLSIGIQSLAALAPSLHPDGRLINVVGQMSLPTVGPLGEALTNRLERWRGRTRYLLTYEGKHWNKDIGPPEKTRLRAERIVEHLPLSIDWSDCESITIALTYRADPEQVLVLSCGAVVAAPASEARLSERSRADRMFKMIERQCPRLYGPSPFVTNAGDRAWLRHYANSDLRVMINAEDEVLVSHFRSTQVVLLGKVDDILSGKGKDPCEAWKRLRNS